MENFKVICKAESHGWVKKHPVTNLVTVKKFFGLIKTTKAITENPSVPGPCKDEICIVTAVDTSGGCTHYALSGYPYGTYDSKYFIRLDEFTETQK